MLQDQLLQNEDVFNIWDVLCADWKKKPNPSLFLFVGQQERSLRMQMWSADLNW